MTSNNQEFDPHALLACNALRWAAFGSQHRGLPFNYRQLTATKWRFETHYKGRDAWVDLELPCDPLTYLFAGAVLLQQLNHLGDRAYG
jgi:hypothetical protein